jgi:two-component system, sensor histidine kinase and response regulator
MARILVIDDEPMAREMLSECLRYDYEVATAEDGATGVELAETFRPDLVICDVSMPRMDGFAVLARFQKIDQMADVPFIFLSGSGDHVTIRQGMVLGADDFLTKPFAVRELLCVVKSRLERRMRRQAIVNKAIDELRLNVTAALPHELRTAIMIMEGYAQLVLEDSDKIDPVQRDMLEAICENAARLRHMAEKYLWYLRTYMPGSVTNDAITVDPDRIIQHIAFEAAQRSNRISDLDTYLEVAAVQIRDDYLSRLVEEIVENAFKFSTPGTPVTVWSAVRGHEYVITVSNWGRELEPEQIERIGGFMQFDREKYEQQGTGLGLIIAKRLSELSGGRLNIGSSDSKTTVVISLPHQQSERIEDFFYA